MGLLDGVLGGIVGAEAMHLLNGVIAEHGGLSGLVNTFQEKGLGNIVQSWVGTGVNHAITSDQVHQALGSDMVTQLAAKFGLNAQDLTQKLAQVLPQAVDHLTPNGSVTST